MKTPSFFNELDDEIKSKIIDLMHDGATPIVVKADLKKLGVNLTLSQIREIYEVCDVNKERDTKVVEVSAKPTIVDIKYLLDRFDIPTDLSNVENSVAAIQRLSQQIFLLEAAIRLEQLEDYACGDRSYPNESVKGFKAAYDVMSAALSLKDIVSVKAAIKTLEIEGYTVKAINEVQDTNL